MSRLPNFMILGAPKCGTTTLYHVLDGHPDIALSRPKEPLFFETEFEKGLSYYSKTYFSHCRSEKAIGEARAAKLYLPFVAQRIRQTLPDARLIAILRNPAERVYSHWWMRTCNGLERLSLEDAVAQNLAAIRSGRSLDEATWLAHIDGVEHTAPVYLEIGHYAQHLECYGRLFPASQLKVLLFDDLNREPERLYSEIFEFLGVHPEAALPRKQHYNAAPSRAALALHKLDRALNMPRLLPRFFRTWFKNALSPLGGPPPMDASTRRWLLSYYRKHNDRLGELLGRDFSHWNSA